MSTGNSVPSAPVQSAAAASLNDSLDWYDREARTNRIEYQVLRLTALVLAAAVPVLTTSHAPSVATAVTGSAIVVVEGIQQLFRFHDRYIGYRSTWNSLDREQRLYNARAGRYAGTATPDRMLAERMDQLLAEETTHWASVMTRSKSSSEAGD